MSVRRTPGGKPGAWSGAVHWQIPLAVTFWMLAILYRAERTIPGDGPHLLIIEHRLADLLREGEIGRFARIFSALVGPQPPLGYIPGILLDILAPASLGGRLLVQGGLLLVAWDALRRFSRPAWPVLPWLLFVASPILWRAVDQYERDLTAAVVVLQIVSHLHAARGFQDRRHTRLFGVWMGVGLLTKYTVPMYLLLPCFLALRHLFERQRRRHLAEAVGLFALVAGPWLLYNREMVAIYIGRSGSETVSLYQRDDLWAPEALALYPLAVKDALGWPGVVFIGIVAVFRRDRAVFLLLATALSGVLALSTLPQGQDRFVLPAVAALAAVTVALSRREAEGGAVGRAPVEATPGTRRLPSPERLLQGLGVGLAAIQMWASAAAFAPGNGGPDTALTHPLETAGDLAWPRSPTYRPAHLDLSDWSLPQAFAALEAAHGGRRGTVGVALTNHPVAPGFAVLARAAQEAGYDWDYATYHAGYGGGMDRFLGPLFDHDWPPPAFIVFFSIRCPGDELLDRWLALHTGEAVFQASLPNNCRGKVARYLPGEGGAMEVPQPAIREGKVAPRSPPPPPVSPDPPG